MKVLLLAVALAAAPPALLAQTIRGTVLDDGGGTPIAGATVELLAEERSLTTARSDTAGAFILLPGRPGTFVVRLTHPSYVTVSSPAITLKGGETLEIELRMGRTAIPLEPLVVTARGRSRLDAFYERSKRAGGFGQFLSRDDIDRRAVTRVTDLLRGMAGVDVVTATGGYEFAPRVQLISMRTRGTDCDPAIYIDGMRVRQVIDAGIDEILRPEVLAGVEVYTRSAGAPPEMVEPGTCGVVAFWSKSDGDGVRWSWLKFLGAAAAFVLMVSLTR